MYLHSLELEHVKCFPEQSFEFQRPDDSYAGWNVFVGGNASGKTTLLKTVALVLGGQDCGRQLLSTYTGWITKAHKSARAKAEIRYNPELDRFTSSGNLPHNPFRCGVRWEQGEAGEPILLKWEERTPSGSRITAPSRGPWSPNAKGWFAAGYGPMRRLTGSSAEAMRHAVGGGAVPRFISLFREDAALSESEIWLKELQFKALEGDRPASALVDGIRRFLNDGLLPEGFAFGDISSDHVQMKTPQGEVLPMRDLSEGYRCVYALMLDIIRNIFDVYGEVDLFTPQEGAGIVVNKPGVLLIDELETHLHPKWQRTICFWLKERFPRIQFFVTTHSPLVLQAADPGGIYFLPAPGEDRKPHRLETHEYERIVLGRAEKVLLGEAFGLSRTRSVWAVKQMDRYRLLAAKKQAHALDSPLERREFEQLGQQLEMVFDDEERATA